MIAFFKTYYNINQGLSKQASEFHPRDKSDKIDCGFWDLFGAIKN